MYVCACVHLYVCVYVRAMYAILHNCYTIGVYGMSHIHLYHRRALQLIISPTCVSQPTWWERTQCWWLQSSSWWWSLQSHKSGWCPTAACHHNWPDKSAERA